MGIRLDNGGNPHTCPVCNGPRSAPTRQRLAGAIVNGCVDASHTGWVHGEDRAWHERPQAVALRLLKAQVASHEATEERLQRLLEDERDPMGGLLIVVGCVSEAGGDAIPAAIDAGLVRESSARHPDGDPRNWIVTGYGWAVLWRVVSAGASRRAS